MLYATHAIVDLDAIRHNLLALRERAGGRELLLPLKADAYGHGAVAVATMVERTRCAQMLGVATVPEAIALREAGVGLPVLKLSHCFDEELPAAIGNRVTLTVVDQDTIGQAQRAAAALGTTAPVHLKIDVGMGRIGSRPEQAVALARLVDEAENLTLQGIFCHLPVSDMADQADETVRELGCFRTAVAAVEAARGKVEMVHATPSGGTLWHDLTGLTMVRPGIAAYGHYPDASTPHTVELEPAMRIVSRISFLKRVLPGETVGYGRTWTAQREGWVATVPIGYADGFSRRNSNTGRMLVGGRSCPVAGRVCMDQTMLDLGPGLGGIRVGDEVVVLGRQGDECITADELAARMDSISYEVTCAIAPRVERIHVEGVERIHVEGVERIHVEGVERIHVEGVERIHIEQG